MNDHHNHELCFCENRGAEGAAGEDAVGDNGDSAGSAVEGKGREKAEEKWRDDSGGKMYEKPDFLMSLADP